ncbi:MAG: hypothetical protein ABJA66_18175 [Actinomycetota bacterium]
MKNPQFKDPKQNGGKKALAEAMEHLEKDPIVLWGWSPDNSCTTPSLSYQDLWQKFTNGWITAARVPINNNLTKY